jgi:hypothetical protein
LLKFDFIIDLGIWKNLYRQTDVFLNSIKDYIIGTNKGGEVIEGKLAVAKILLDKYNETYSQAQRDSFEKDVSKLKTPIQNEVFNIVDVLFNNLNGTIRTKIVDYVQGDLKKIYNLHQIYVNKPDFFTNNIIENIFQIKSYNDDTKIIIHKLISNRYELKEHNSVMNETDRTSVGLLWHENIINAISKYEKNISIPFYIQQLENICFADYIDRVTFQKQIWQFNEMSSLIKTLKNHKLYHEQFSKSKPFPASDVRFTKVLTKYSTEYNNSIFIQNLCQHLGMDKNDLFGFFVEIKDKYDDNQIYNLFENYEITKLDINRIYRYIDKYIKEHAVTIDDKEYDTTNDNDNDEDL